MAIGFSVCVTWIRYWFFDEHDVPVRKKLIFLVADFNLPFVNANEIIQASFNSNQIGPVFFYLFHFSLRFGQDLERVKFAGRSGDFLWMLLVCAALLVPIGFALKIVLMSNSLIMSVIYYWARNNPDSLASIGFGIPAFKAKYLPWVMVALTTILGGNPLAEILGIAVGHIYFLMADLVPRDYRINLISTPNFIAQLFDDPRPVPNQPGQYQQPAPDAGPRGPRYTWGTGQRLGNQ